MPKELTLKPRAITDNAPTWHDVYILSNAIQEMAKGKTVTKMAVELAIARKITLAKEKAGLAQDNLTIPITISLRNTEARILWKGLEKLTAEQYGRDIHGRPSVPPLGTLDEMLHDIAEQLDQKMPEPDDD